MPVRRHVLLYDLERWRRYRLPLVLLGSGCLAATILTPLFQKGSSAQSTTTLLSFLGAGLYGFAFNFWLRQRFSSLAVEDGQLVVRRTGVTMRIPLTQVKRPRVARIGTIVKKPEWRRRLPRPAARWLEQEAVTMRLDSDLDQLKKLSRTLGRNYLFEDDLVVPVPEPQVLVAEITDATPRPEPGPAAPRRRRRR